jgi:uncharacterized membrane protein
MIKGSKRTGAIIIDSFDHMRSHGVFIFKYFLKKYFLYIFLNYFDVFILKLNFKTYKIYYFNIFSNKTNFKKELLLP